MLNKITCIVIDDEIPALNLLTQFITQSNEVHLLEKFKSPIKARDFLEKNKVDIIFCDIQMPEMNGIELIKVIPSQSLVIFTTAYSEFASEAFDIDAIDYLKKPFSYERFNKALLKAKEYLELIQVKNINLTELQETQKNYFTVKANYKINKVYFNDILFIEAFQEYVKIITTSERFITYERMKNMENILPKDNFLRVHRSYIVAIDKIKSITGNLIEINEQQIPIRKEMKEIILNRL